ncbi:antibiotic biosynthesis monooxygenase [Erythrobacter litoralis]|uniref:putative quinol monooxygenase n=1 Tax=Erythrobacter litoralis TaxID=39960 RepID=UPI002436015B|nr:putative quinol monooxygenase [Erythrobacter litoralis]MDG6079015.1 antibiotic biosynthesis monooxygenase [Erythrobacter litoralis]
MTDRLIVLARITPKREHLDEAREAIRAILEDTRAEEGCLTFKLAEDEDAGVLHLYEEWADPKALAHHHAQSYTVAVFEAYESWLSEEPEILHLKPVA